MMNRKRASEQRIDSILAGRAPSEDAGLDRFFHALETTEAASGPIEPLAAQVAAVALEAGDTVVISPERPVSRPLPRKWRRRIVLSTLFSSLAGKLLVGSVALAATTGGLAATGNLPDPVQAAAQGALANVGISIPGPDVEANTTAADVTDVIENGDPTEDGETFGRNVADQASDGKSDAGLSTADSADTNADVSENYTENAGSQADDAEDNASVADDFTGEAGSQADVADDAGSVGEGYRP